MSLPPESVDTSFSRREALFVAMLWIAACTYTVLYAARYAYRPSPLSFVLGMPFWVFWGVMVPWIVVSLITLWFAAYRMKDEDLGEEAEAHE
jgi:fatty acid desaturase